jgi:hypothetical protein
VVVPPALAATAQAIYGGLAVGTMTAIVTLVSGPLYGALEPCTANIAKVSCSSSVLTRMIQPLILKSRCSFAQDSVASTRVG